MEPGGLCAKKNKPLTETNSAWHHLVWNPSERQDSEKHSGEVVSGGTEVREVRVKLKRDYRVSLIKSEDRNYNLEAIVDNTCSIQLSFPRKYNFSVLVKVDKSQG